MPTLSVLDWTICVGYLAVVAGLGVWFSRSQHDNEDYFLGGRRMHWLPIGLSIFAGTFSSLSFVGLPREGAYDDYHLLLGILFIPLVVMPIVGKYFLPMYFRMGVTSAYEYLEVRFDRRLRLLASALFVLYSVGWMGSLLVAVGKILQVVLGLTEPQLLLALVAVGAFATLYTTMGGVKAVVWTDALQAVALGGSMIAVLLLTIDKINGGWGEVWRLGQQHGKFDMFRMEVFTDKPTFFGACAFGFFVYLAGHAVHFTAVQRYVSMPSLSAARRSLAVNGVMVSVICAVFFLVGSALFVFYSQHDPAFFHQLADQKKGDQLLPHFVLVKIGAYGLTGLLLAGLFAAAMSSMDSGINSLTASVVCDWLGGREISLWTSRLLTVVFGVLAIITAVIIAQIGGPIFRTLMTIAGTFLGLMLGVFLLGMCSRRANSVGALIGAGAGVAVFLVAKRYGMTNWWDGACTTVTTMAVGWLTSLLFEASTPIADEPNA